MTNSARRMAGEALTSEQMDELRQLAGRPDSEIDFSDIRERSHKPQPELVLEEHTVTLRLDAEVAAWLKSVAEEDSLHINLVLKRVAHRRQRPRGDSQGILSKAS